MNPQFLDRIEYPRPRRLEQLRDQAIKNVKSELPDRSVDVHNDAVFRKLAYTYYYDWSTDDPDFMMISEDPGDVGSRHTSDLIDFAELPEDDPLAQIGLYRDFAVRWLASDNYRFSETFFGTCAEEGLITLSQSVRSYIQDEDIFDDFYVTDANKYRSSVSSSVTRAALSTAFTTTELEKMNPELIFAFGNDAWDLLATELALEPVEGEHPPKAGITEIDGRLYSSSRLIDTYVLPLLHMSGRAFGMQRKPDEYRERLVQGLRTWDRIS